MSSYSMLLLNVYISNKRVHFFQLDFEQRGKKLCTASLRKSGALWQLNSALSSLVSSQSLNSGPFLNTAGEQRGGPKSGTRSLLAMETWEVEKGVGRKEEAEGARRRDEGM